jgi:poly-gamma-glutamate capsule biosynthesis protein CapA/YwtB (metallophosphatase superfamily)
MHADWCWGRFRIVLTRRLVLALLASIPMRRATRPENVPRAVPRTRLVFGGDIMLSRFVGQLARARRDPASPLRDLAPVLASADIAFANLESPFSDRGKIFEGRMVFKAEPDMISGLELAGIDVVSTANNHSRDCGRRGVEFTLDWLAKHGIAAAGSGESAEAAHRGIVLERNGVKFGFLAYTYDQSNGNHRDSDDRVAVMDVARMRRDVADLKTRAGVAVVSMHAGDEYSPRPNERQTEFAHAAIEAGASVVAGHHPHVVEPWERYREGVIFYSLGNLVFDQFQRAETQHGVLGEVVFAGTAIERAGVMPVDIVRTAPRLSAVNRRE